MIIDKLSVTLSLPDRRSFDDLTEQLRRLAPVLADLRTDAVDHPSVLIPDSFKWWTQIGPKAKQAESAQVKKKDWIDQSFVLRRMTQPLPCHALACLAQP